MCAMTSYLLGPRPPYACHLFTSHKLPILFADTISVSADLHHLRRLSSAVCPTSLGDRLAFVPGTRKLHPSFIPSSAIMSESDNAPSDSSRRVTIGNLAGERLVGIIDDTGSSELVVICHGFRATKNDKTLNLIVPTILKSGTSTFRFDFSGNGESEGNFSYANYWKEVEDLRVVILHWRAEGRQGQIMLNYFEVVTCGDVVLLYASRYSDVSTVINMSGRFALNIGPMARFGEKGMKHLEEEGYLDVKNKLGIVEYTVTLDGLQDRLSTDIDSAIRCISKDTRVLTIHGSKDEIVPVEDAYEFDKRIANHVLRIINGANHTFEGKQEELATLVLDFLQGKLLELSKL